MEKSVLCIGLVCLDVIAETNGYPLEDSDQRISELYYQRGGNASNSSTVIAQLGMPSEFLGTLSNTMELEFISEDFKSHNVCIEKCPVIADCGLPTSMVILNSQNGSRTILHHATSLPEISIDHFSKINSDDYSWIHFEGRSLNVETIKKMIELIRTRSPNVKISVECEKPRAVLKELLPLGDVVFISKEFSQYIGYQSMEESVKGIAESIKSGAVIVCAWGSAGAAAYRSEQLHISAPFPPEKIVDTLGAGDTFNAAFICCQVKQMDVARSLETACRVAGYKISHKGFKNIGSLCNVFQ